MLLVGFCIPSTHAVEVVGCQGEGVVEAGCCAVDQWRRCLLETLVGENRKGLGVLPVKRHELARMKALVAVKEAPLDDHIQRDIEKLSAHDVHCLREPFLDDGMSSLCLLSAT